MRVCNTLHNLTSALNIEASRRPNGYASDMESGLPARRDLGAHQVAGLEPMHTPGTGQVATWEAISVQPGALVAAAARALHHQRGFLPGAHRSHLTHAYSIERMDFGDAKPRAIELRATARSQFDGYARRFQPLHQRPACRIERGRILKRPLCLRQNARQPRRVFSKKHLDRQLALACISPRTTQRQVAHPVRAAERLRDNVLNLQGNVVPIAIRARAAPLRQQVFTHLVTRKRALLIFDA